VIAVLTSQSVDMGRNALNVKKIVRI
jgi:hypothetical protein